MIDIIIHSNTTNWGKVWHIITTDGKGIITIELDNEDKKRFYFYGLSVTPDLRRKGVGSTLLKAAEKLSIENGGNVLRLNINKPYYDWLYQFYLDNGFEIHDEDENEIYLVKYIKQ